MDVVAIGGIGDVGDDFLPRLRQRIERELDIPGSNLLVNASHTHPPGRLLCGNDELVERTFGAVREAAMGMAPATVGWGRGREDRLTMNRNLRLRDSRHWTIRHANPCPPDDEVVGLGPIDPDIGVIRVDRADGRPLAAVYNFACHPLFGDASGAITANFPGVASRLVEEHLGGATALFLQGAGGDVIDVSFKDFKRPRDIEPLGVALGLAVLEALRMVETGDADLSVITETIALPRRTDIPERIGELEREQSRLLASLRFTCLNFKAFLPLYLEHALHPEHPADYSYRYLQEESVRADGLRAMDAHTRSCVEKYLANIRAMEKLARIQDDIATLEHHRALNDAAGEPTISAEVQGIRIGKCVLITSSAELLVEVGLNIKRRSPYEHTFVVAYSNGYIYYGAPAADYSKGGYEVTECLLAPEWQEIYERKASEIISRL